MVSHSFLVLLLCCCLTRVFALKLGMNLPGNNYYNNVPMYYDVFLQTSGNDGRWDVHGATDAPSLLDSTGAPIPTPIGGGQFSTEAWAGVTQYYPAGNYSLSWDGTGSLSFPRGVIVHTPVRTVSKDGRVSNTATVTLPGPPANGPTDNSWIQIIAHLPVTNIHLYSPPEFKVQNSVFRADFLETLRPFSTFRFMDALNTNGNPIQNWSQRTLPTAGSRGGTLQGIPYEDIIDLVKTTKKAAWINVPARATDDYVCRLARLLALGELGPAGNLDAPCDPKAPPSPPYTSTHLDSSDTLYLEYSNEVWNYGFQQTQDFVCMANLGVGGYDCQQFTAPISDIAKAALANNSLGWETTQDNKWGRAQQLMFVLAKRVVDIFRQVFTLSKSPPTLHTLMNVQFVYSGCYWYAYPFFQKNFGPFGDTFDYYAVAPYFNIDNDTYSGSLDSIFSNLDTILDTNPNPTNPNNILKLLNSQVFTEAKTLGVKGVVAYEGGQGLNGDVNANIKIDAQADTRMYDDTRKYLQTWDKYVGSDSLFNYYSLAGGYSKYGCWGSLTSTDEHGSQKYDAMLSLTAIPGDANLDGVVNNLDCDILKLNYKAGISSLKAAKQLWWRDADFNHDGIVNHLDLEIMNSHSSPNMCNPTLEVISQ